LTKEQFSTWTKICLDEMQSREYVLDGLDAIKVATPKRYIILKKRVKENL